jgi:lysozyme family protein
MLDQAFRRLLEIEGGFASIEGDRGGATFMGVSSRQYPELKDQIESASLNSQFVKELYYRDYWRVIYGIDRLEDEMPDLAWLIFIGKVHGAGDEHLVELVQRWLVSKDYNVLVDGIWGPMTFQAVINLSKENKEDLRSTIANSIDTLAKRRSMAVGIKPEAIKKRVEQEHLIAQAFRGLESQVAVETIISDSERWTRVKTSSLEFFIREV